MIRFDLICDNAHEFDSWFANSKAYEHQKQAGLVTCPFCNSTKIDKRLMVPSISAKANRSDNDQPSPLSGNDNPAFKDLAENIRKLRKDVSENADYVGKDFARKAREIHYEEKPARNIYGEATLDDAKSLLEEGVNVLPMPSLPEEKN